MNKPEYIGDADWKTLIEKYKGNLPTEIIKKIESKYPIQYLIGNVEFLDAIIEVNENVLIPRFETELMVEKIISRINDGIIDASTIIDLGTGSGAIAIALSKVTKKTVDALDINEEALNVAKLNAKKNNACLNFLKKDILNEDLELNHTLIVSNPPYVDYEEKVDPQIKYEPQNAIFAEDKGLIFYKKIIEQAKSNKQKSFSIVFEIGCTQAKEIMNIVKEVFPNAEIIVEKDYTNRDRYVFVYIS